jgi:exodeoxyribonuclease VII large subunit
VAAEMVIEKEQAFLERIDNLEKRMIHQQKYSLQEETHRVFSLIQHRAFQNFKLRLLNLHQKIDELETRAWNVIRAKGQLIAESKARLSLLEEKMSNVLKNILQNLLRIWERLSVQLHNLSPLNILKKGYTLCWRNGGKHLIRRIEEVEERKELMVSFYKGEFSCLVKNVDRSKLIQTHIVKEKK